MPAVAVVLLLLPQWYVCLSYESAMTKLHASSVPADRAQSNTATSCMATPLWCRKPKHVPLRQQIKAEANPTTS